jgi:hypothetical protein
MNAFSRFGWFAVALNFVNVAIACDAPCASCPQPAPTQPACVIEETQPSWIFRRSTYTHDPVTGARVAQYMRTPPVEPLDDERNVTSRYRRIQTNLRGTDGSNDSTYEVQAWGNGRGGIDAEWERFHNAWKESYLQNGYFNQSPGFGGGNQGPWGNGNGWNGNGPGGGWGGGWGGGGNWGPGNWGPQQGPWQNNGGPGQNGNNWHNGNGP